MIPGLRLDFGLLGVLLAVAPLAACGRDQPLEAPFSGLIVEQVEAGYGASRGGVLPGDLLVAWRQEAVDPGSKWQFLTAPIDLDLAELEGGQTRSVNLRLVRAGESMQVTVAPAPWKVRVRPFFGGEVQGRFEGGKNLLADGNVNEALMQWQELRDAVRPVIAAWLSIRGAETLTEADRSEDAEVWVNAAVRAAQDSADPNLIAWNWLRVGDLWQDARNYPAAIEAYIRGIGSEPSSWRLLARLHRALGDAQFRSPDQRPAAEAFGRARSMWRQHEIHGSEYLAATLGLGKVERNQSHFDRASDYFGEVVDTAERIAADHPYVGFSLQEAGTLAYWQSDLVTAEKSYRAGAEVLSATGIADNNLANLYMGLGSVSLVRGNLADAEWSYSQAKSIFERNAPKSLLVAWSLRGLANVAWARSELFLAQRRYREALGILDSGTPHKGDRALALGELGRVAREQGDLQAARRAISEALEILESEYPQIKFVPRARTELAAVLLELGEVEAAEGHLVTALREWQLLIPGSLDQAKTHFQFGELEYRLGRLAQARRHHQAAQSIRSRLAPRSSIEAQSYYAMAKVVEAEGSPDQALDHLLSALESIEAQLGHLGASELSRARYRQRHADIYKATIDVLLDLGHRERAFDVLERYRTQLGKQILDLPSLNLQHASRPELVARRNRLVDEYETTWRRLSTTDAGPGSVAEVERLRSRLAELEQERQIVREQIRATDPGSAAKDPVAARWADLQHDLEPESGVLSYSVGSGSSWLFAAFGGELKVLRLNAREEELSELVNRFRMLLAAEGPGGAGQEALTRYGRDLYRLLVAPVADWMAPAKELIVLPDGPLHRLPFPALVREGASRQYLIEWKPLVLRASLAAVEGEFSISDQRVAPSDRTLVAFGDVVPPGHPAGAAGQSPVGTGSPPVAWPALPFARAELEALGNQFGVEAEIRKGAAASEGAAKRRAAEVRYLHFATHARLDSVQPLDSFLLLSASESGVGEDGEDGFLRAWEVIEEMQFNAQVVTLSACESGLGEEAAGYGMLGLTRAFQVAGARSVVASLWQVNDRSTSALMVHFYRALNEGLAPQEALREAQMAVAANRVGIPVTRQRPLERLRVRLASLLGRRVPVAGMLDYSHPHHWAAFQVFQGTG